MSRSPPTEAELRARFLFEDGSPAANVKLALRGWIQNEQARLQFGEPDAWEDQEFASDEAGEVVVRFDPPRAFQFVLEANLDGFAPTGWRFDHIEQSARRDLGDVVLARGGDISGYVVDAVGNPLTGERWVVYARPLFRDGDEREQARGIARTDPLTGAFRIEDMPAGRTRMKADSSMTGWVDGPVVEVEAGSTVTTEIVYDGPDTSARVALTVFADPFLAIDDATHIALVGSEFERVAARIEGSWQSYAFDDVPEGVYSIVIDDPRYEPWREDGVRPGSALRVNLRGNVALRFAVTSEESGETIDTFAVRVTFRDADSHPREFEPHDGSEPLPHGVLEGMLPGDYDVEVRTEEYGNARVKVDGVLANETRDVSVVLRGRTVVAGRVLRSNGVPVAEQLVRLLRPAKVNDSHLSPIAQLGDIDSEYGAHESVRVEIDRTVSDGQGRFRFDVSVSGPLILDSDFGWNMLASTEPFTLAPGQPREDLDLIAPDGARLTGRVLGVEEAIVPDLRVAAVPEAIADGPLPMAFDVTFASLDPDGRFAFEPISAGATSLFLVLPEVHQRVVPLDDAGRPIHAEFLGQVTLVDGERAERTFEFDRLPGIVDVEVVSEYESTHYVRVALGGYGGANAILDASRRASLPAFPGDHEVSVGFGSAFYAHPSLVTVEPGRRTSIEVRVDLAPGTIRVVDASGETVVDVFAAVSLATDPDYEFLAEISDSGTLELVLSPGLYVLEAYVDTPNDPEHAKTLRAHFEWTADGPLADEVRVLE